MLGTQLMIQMRLVDQFGLNTLQIIEQQIEFILTLLVVRYELPYHYLFSYLFILVGELIDLPLHHLTGSSLRFIHFRYVSQLTLTFISLLLRLQAPDTLLLQLILLDLQLISQHLHLHNLRLHYEVAGLQPSLHITLMGLSTLIITLSFYDDFIITFLILLNLPLEILAHRCDLLVGLKKILALMLQFLDVGLLITELHDLLLLILHEVR